MAETSLSAIFITPVTAERDAIVKDYDGKTGFTRARSTARMRSHPRAHAPELRKEFDLQHPL